MSDNHEGATPQKGEVLDEVAFSRHITVEDGMRVVDVGAGTDPHPDATETLDIRKDIEVDYPGVDIGSDPWPWPSDSVDRVVCRHVLEHVPPDRLGHVWRELQRVLGSNGEATIRLPHAGTWGAATDPTHRGTGGTTPDIAEYFGGNLEGYWPDVDLDVAAHAELEAPLFLRPALRWRWQTADGRRSMQWVKLPWVTAEVVLHVG